MTIEIVTDFRILLEKARSLAKAESSGDIKEIEQARNDHDQYKELCLKSNNMRIGLTWGDL